MYSSAGNESIDSGVYYLFNAGNTVWAILNKVIVTRGAMVRRVTQSYCGTHNISGMWRKHRLYRQPSCHAV